MSKLSNSAKARIYLTGHTPAAWAKGDKCCWPRINELARIELLTTTLNLVAPTADMMRLQRAEEKRLRKGLVRRPNPNVTTR